MAALASPRKSDGADHIKHGHLDIAGIASIMMIGVATKAFLAYPSRMAKSAQTAAWVVPIASGILSIAWLAPLVFVLSKHPGKNIIEITQKLAGKFVAVMLGIALYFMNFGIITTVSREIAEALATVILPLTPLSFTLAVLFGVGLYVALKGTEVLGRLAILSATATILYVVFLALLSYDAWDISNVTPLLGPGLPELAKTCVIRQSTYGELISLGILAPYLRKTSALGKAASISGLSSLAILTLTVLSCQMTFPYPSLAEIPVPFLRVIRLIYLSRFFQRFDVFFVILWLSAGSLTIAAAGCVNSHIAGSLWPKASYPISVFVTAALGLVAARLIRSNAMAMILDFDLLRPYSVILLYVWPYLLLILQFIRGKKNEPEANLSDQAGL